MLEKIFKTIFLPRMREDRLRRNSMLGGGANDDDAGVGKLASESVDGSYDGRTLERQASDEDFGAESGSLKVSWLELFFDLSLVLAIAKLGEYLHEHMLESDEMEAQVVGRYCLQMFAFWWIWHTTSVLCNLITHENVIHTGAILGKMCCVSGMAAQVMLPGHSADVRFACFYAAARFIDAAVLGVAGVIFLHSSKGAGEKVRNLIIFQVVFTFLEGTMWIISSATSDGPAILWWWAGAAIFIMMGRFISILRMTRKVARLDENHILERQGLLLIVVLGEAVTASAVTFEDADFLNYFIAMSTIVCFFLLKILYFDCPKSEVEAKSALNDVVGQPEDETKAIWIIFQRLPLAMYGPAHLLLVASLTFISAVVRCFSAAPAEGAGPSTSQPLSRYFFLAWGAVLVALAAIRSYSPAHIAALMNTNPCGVDPRPVLETSLAILFFIMGTIADADWAPYAVTLPTIAALFLAVVLEKYWTERAVDIV